MEFGILGPLQISVAGQSLAIGGARTRAVLALLLLNANRVVSADTLADQLWPDLTPDRAAANLQVRLSELRRALRSVGEADRLETHPPGYVIRVEDGELDVLHFERLFGAGRRALTRGDTDGALQRLEAALALWRGEPLADIERGTFASAERARLEEEHLGALEMRLEVMLASGRHQETIGELEALTASHPLRERLWYQRVLALYRSGRQADALRALRELRSTLVDQLGLEPGRELRQLEARILRQDPELDPRRAARDEGHNEARPQTRYAESGGLHIAYQVIGEGDRDIVLVPGLLSHVELAWEDPGTVAFYRRLASLGRLILFDKRDTGLSDRAASDLSLEERMEDVRAVMQAVSSERAVLFGYSEGGPMSILFAATYPEKVSGLILGSAFARWFPAPDYPCGPGAEQVYSAMEEIATHRWGQGATIQWFLPSRVGSPGAREAIARFERMAISPGAFLRMVRMIREIDVRPALPAIQVPTLVIQRLGDLINPPFYGRYIAEHIPGARYLEQPGDHALRYAEGSELDELSDEIAQFLAAIPRETTTPSRALTTVMLAQPSGDPGAFDRVRLFHGQVRSVSADTLMATFDAPGQAIRCAAGIRDDATARGIRVRIGIHTGEVELVGNKVAGTSVEITDSIAGRAGAGEILVSRTVKDLVVGSGISFAEHGSHLFTAADERWTLFRVTGD